MCETGNVLYRNLIGDAGVGEWHAEDQGDVTESAGTDTNVYYANVADFNFPIWSDDEDYRNDRFPLSKVYGLRVLKVGME